MRTLEPAQADYFLYLHRNLILFTNKKYKITDKFQTITDIENLDLHAMEYSIGAIRTKMYESDNVRQFCHQNPYGLRDKDLLIIEQWQNNVAMDA